MTKLQFSNDKVNLKQKESEKIQQRVKVNEFLVLFDRKVDRIVKHSVYLNKLIHDSLA